MQGAAWATVISLGLSFFLLIFFFAGRCSSLKLRLRHFLFTWTVLGEIIALGFAAFVRHASKSLLFLAVNNSLKFYSGDMGIAAFGLVTRLLAFMLLPIPDTLSTLSNRI